MNIIELLKKELEDESAITRKMLSIVPEDKWDWKPHTKNMNLMQLSTHVAEMPEWIAFSINSDGIDFATTPYVPHNIQTNVELMDIFSKSLAAGRMALDEITDENILNNRWVLRAGDTILADNSKFEAVRHAFAQTIHHRAQLGVYLRLLNIPIPGSYGPSADEQGF
ncbi:MAG: DinB family protein [Sphingobacteriales bacterium JAD_PAG50586_3]|nr:MAG: DinB family protein [Sphingobacteriales bacterium JAD_PAG50586_3]